jgi:predicted metal-dependent phosphoesterase TrpH
MPYAIDLHIHTTAGSADSNLRPPVLRERAVALGLHGVQITEHFRVWSRHEADDLVAGHGLLVFRGMEWNTELGHILVLGLDTYRPEIRAAAELRRYVVDHGGLMIAAHPFRHAFDPIPALWKAHKSSDVSLDAARRHPVFEFVDAVEVLNGASTDKENDLTARVAASLGLPGVGGSDAHYAEDVGRAVTLFDQPIRTEQDLIDALRRGCFRAARGPAVFESIDRPS